MNEQEQTRDDTEQQFRRAMTQLVANAKWFNQFFDGIRQLYGITFDMLPAEFF